MEQKPNENAPEAADNGLFTSATRVQIPLGTQRNQAVSSEPADEVSGDRQGDSTGPSTDEVIENFRRYSLAHDTHPECEAGRWDRAVLSKLAAFARVEGVFGVLFDRQVEGEKLTAEDAIEEFRQAALEDSWERPSASGAKGNEGVSEQSAASSNIVRVMPLGDPGYPWAYYPWMPIDDAIGRADSCAAAGTFTEEQEASIVLAAEVRRLREVVRQLQVMIEPRDEVQHDEVKRLRDTIRVMLTNEGKLHAQIAELQAERAELIAYGDGWKQQWEEMRDTMWKPAMDKLARVEALIELEHDDSTVRVSRLRAALRGEP